MMAPMEKSEIGTLKELPISQTDTSSGNRRRRPLRSRTVDTLLHILSFCYADSSRIIQNSDKGTGHDVPSDCTDIMPNGLLFQEQMPMDETQVVFDTQEGGLYNKHMESAEHDHNLLGEKNGLSHEVNTNSSVNFDIKSQDNYDMISSSPNLPTDKDVEELGILEDLMDFVLGVDTKSEDKTDSEPKDFICTEPGPENDNSSILLFTEPVENGGKDMAEVVNKTTRNLVNYSEIGFESEHVLPLQRNPKINATKNQDLVQRLKDSGAHSNKKRLGSCTKEERTNKKSKKSVASTPCPENLPSLGEQHADASRKVADASANNKKDRIKRTENNRKLGVERLKLQQVIKEKKISYCGHYMKGRCHEGEKCKFSHDTIPLTKSKPCGHFARHTCMKGDDCPFDHELSKYPCNNYQTKGSCYRGSDCMFSHEAKRSEAPLNASNGSKPEQKPPSNSGSKLVETKSCLVPTLVDITPKSAQPPKGINFLSQEKLPLASREVKKITKTPSVIQDSKEITKPPSVIQDPNETTKTSSVVQDSKEITKAPPLVPRGVNFLSFGKKPGLDYSNGGFSFKIRNRVEKSLLSGVEVDGLKPNSMVNVVNEIKVDFPTDGPNSSKKPMPMMSSTSQKALHSTLAFASKFDSGVKSKA